VRQRPVSNSPTSTFGLIERFKAGDEEAFDQLFEKYRRRLAVLIHYKLNPELRLNLDVDDILQETFLAASRDIGRFTYRSPGSFLSWLSRIAEHAVIDAVRFQNRQKRAHGELLPFRSDSNPQGAEPADSNTPSRLFRQEEGLRRLLERLNNLPEDYRQAVLLTKIEGLSTAEAAEKMGKSRQSLAVLLHRALKRFREQETLGEHK